MTRALSLSKRQAQTLIRAAEAEKAIVEVKIGEATYRLIPHSMAEISSGSIDQTQKPSAFRTFEEYRSWRDKRANRD